MCAPWIIVRFVSSHIPASRLVKMTDFDWGNHPYYWFTIGKSRINMWVCVCAQHVRGQTWTAHKFVFFAGYPPIKYGLLANIIGTLTIKKISMGLHFAGKSQKKLGLYVYHSPKFEVSNFSIYLEGLLCPKMMTHLSSVETSIVSSDCFRFQVLQKHISLVGG